MTQHGIYSIEEICGVDMNGPPANANYLKCRLFPNDLSLKRSDFNLRTYEEYEDNFYDTNSFAYGKQKMFIRRRGDEVVVQRTRDVSNNSHCHEEKSREHLSWPDLQCFLGYRFRRYRLLPNDLFVGYAVMLDDMIVDEHILYSVITISKELRSLSADVVAQALESLDEKLSKYHGYNDKYRCLPTWSKFMFAVKTSPKFESLESIFDAYVTQVSEAMEDTIDYVSQEMALSKYAKEYIWTVSYGLEYLQAMIYAGKPLGEAFKVFFADKQELLEDTDVHFAACVESF